MNDKTKILDSKQVDRKIKRIAYEIYENNYSAKEIFLVGINGGGYNFAQRLEKSLTEISNTKISLSELIINKKNPSEKEATINGLDINSLESQTLILVDDVLNTAKTLVYAIKPFLKVNLAKLETAILVNRSHGKYPISASYSGHELPTTISNHIEVNIDEKEAEVLIY